ncbi:uncharacterized protein CTRU02_203091 [Colletotrichum truncatum]|uniref:Uncharacterized protein n=1 Tax=Colletotrichum truncatum TaxID=5467 RepID=A0ACC3Z8A9_COLTU|nr:uncharacterized protein CTRU02_08927 [Colletotrichum truncatum]KAF6789135.1 hypothetical protein CTRU02_08927 [Colletotrichum truncatum]
MDTTNTTQQPPNLAKTKATIRNYWDLSGPFGLAVRAALRILQFVLAVVIIGLYGASLASWDHSMAVSRTNWIFALVPAVLSVLTCAYHCLATVTHAVWCVWDFILAVLWAALCGVSSAIVIGGEDGAKVTGDVKTRLAAGAWIAGVIMVLYVFNAIHGCAWCCVSRKLTRTTERENKIDLEHLPNRES